MRRLSRVLLPALLTAACGGDDGGGGDDTDTASTDGVTTNDTESGGTTTDPTSGGSSSSVGTSGSATDSGGSSGGSTGGLPPPVDRHEPVFLPGARVGVAYASMLPAADAYEIVAGDVPAGLSLDVATGAVTGTPTAAGIHELTVTADTGSEVVGLDVQIAVYESDDAGTTTNDDPSMPGPHEVSRTIVTVDSITISTGTYQDIQVLVTHPATVADGDTLPDGTFPLIAFHHAAHNPPDIFDDYGELHEHWASHGYIVASVDSTMNLTPPNLGWQGQSWTNLSNMSTFQRAAITRMLDANDDMASRFHEHVDSRRVVVSGHSRGGGASLISALEDPSIFGVIAFEPVSLIQTPGQSYANPDTHGDRDYPTRPILIFSAANDRDEPWPLVDTIYEQRTGHTSLVTIHGANHEWTYDTDTPGNQTSQSLITEEERHAVDQAYSTAFLQRFVEADATRDGMMFGEQGLTTSLSSMGVSVASDRYMSTQVLVDDYQDVEGENLLGESNTGTSLDTNQNGAPYDAGLTEWGIFGEARARINARGQARNLAWSSGTGSLEAAVGSLDLTDRRYATIRVHRDCPPPPGNTNEPDDTCPAAPMSFTLQIGDGQGGSHTVTTTTAILGEEGVVGRHWSNLSLPLSDAAGVDLGDVTSVSVVFDQLGTGEIWIDDLRFE